MNTERKITILGEEIAIRFCMAVEIAYEEIIGAPFDVTELARQKNSLALGMAAILTANPDTTITLDKLMKEASGKEIADLNNAVVQSMTAWFNIPAVVEKEPEPVGEEKVKN